MSSVSTRKPVTLLSDAFGAMTVRVIGMVLFFASTTLAARVLGPEEYGAFNAAFSLAVMLATLAPLGTDRIMLRSLSTSGSTEDSARETALTHHATIAVALPLFVLFMIGVIGGNIVGLSDGWQVTLFLSAVMFVPVALSYLRQWVAVPILGTRAAFIPEQTIFPVVFMMILGMLKLLQFPMTAFSAAFSFAAIKVAIWVWSIQDDRLGQIYRIAIRQNFAFGGVLERLKSGLPFSGLALGTAMLQTSLPLAIVAACGYSVAAQFSIALSFANLAGVPLGILNLCVLPRCTTLVRNSQLDEAGCLVSSTAGIALLSSSAIGISTCVLSPVAIQMLGASYSDISLILWLLVIASVLDSIPGPSVALLQAMHLEGVWSRIILMFIPLQLFTVWAASSVGGLTGAAIGYLVTRALYNLLIIGTVYRLRGVLILPKVSMNLLFKSVRTTQPSPPI